EQHHRLALAQERAGRAVVEHGLRHAAGPPTRRARLRSTSATSRQKLHTSPHAGIPQRAQAFGGRSSSAAARAQAACPPRRNSRTKDSLVPGLAASRRLSASLYTSCVAPTLLGHSSTT